MRVQGVNRVVCSALLAALTGLTWSDRPAFGAITFDVVGLAGSGVTGKVTFAYSSISSTDAALTVTIENTTSNASRISGFAFNVPTIAGTTFSTIGGASSAGVVVAIAPTSSSAIPENAATNEAGWYAKWKSNDIKTPNAAGDFDFGVMNASNGNAFITDGVGSGPRILNLVDSNDSTTFTFRLTGTGLQSMSDPAFETAFMNELSTSAGYYNFGVRFQGIPGSIGSDLAVKTQLNPVPIPGAFVLAGVGIGFVGMMRRRFS